MPLFSEILECQCDNHPFHNIVVTYKFKVKPNKPYCFIRRVCKSNNLKVGKGKSKVLFKTLPKSRGNGKGFLQNPS